MILSKVAIDSYSSYLSSASLACTRDTIMKSEILQRVTHLYYYLEYVQTNQLCKWPSWSVSETQEQKYLLDLETEVTYLRAKPCFLK